MSGALLIWQGHPYFRLVSRYETRSRAIYFPFTGCIMVLTLSLEHRSRGDSRLNRIVGGLSEQIRCGLNRQ
jgi:hypothetical protein